MAQTPTRELLKPSDLWFKDMALIVATLQDNPWRKPLLVAWTPEGAIPVVEEWQQKNDQRWSVWRHCLRRHLQDLREYFNDCAPDRIPQLENSRLWRMAHLLDSYAGLIERQNYSKEECLADLQSMTDRMSPPKLKREHDRLQRLRKQLKGAIQNAKTDHVAAAKDIGINRDTLEDFLNNKDKRSPRERTERKIRAYVAKHPARSDK
jgi:hypothetical protein